MRLRPTRTADIEFVLAAETDPANAGWLLAWNEARHRASLDDADICHLVLESGPGRAIGFAILAGLTDPHGSIECRRMVITEKGQGHGRPVMGALMSLAFEDLAAHRFWLHSQVRNARARHLYAGVGFVEEGVLRECRYQHGDWQSLVVMSVLETEYRSAGG